MVFTPWVISHVQSTLLYIYNVHSFLLIRIPCTSSRESLYTIARIPVHQNVHRTWGCPCLHTINLSKGGPLIVWTIVVNSPPDITTQTKDVCICYCWWYWLLNLQYNKERLDQTRIADCRSMTGNTCKVSYHLSLPTKSKFNYRL